MAADGEDRHSSALLRAGRPRHETELALAVGLDFRRLFFLVVIVPVIGLFFVVHGLFSGWADRRTGDPLVAGIANAIAFAWAIGVTFPLLAG